LNPAQLWHLVPAGVLTLFAACQGSGGGGGGGLDNLPVTLTLTATAKSASQIDLAWTLHNTANAYDVHMNGTFLGRIDTLSVTVSALSPNTRYCFIVYAMVLGGPFGGAVGRSNERCATTAIASLPPAAAAGASTPQESQKQADYDLLLIDHPGTADTRVFGINDEGIVVGSGITNVDMHPFAYDLKTSTFTSLPSASGDAAIAVAPGMNSQGDVVGSASFESNPPGMCPGAMADEFAWKRAADGAVTYFQVNGKRTRARGINDAGYIVGEISDSGSVRGFVVKPIGLPCESLTVADEHLLGHPGYDILVPIGISDSGVVVGVVKGDNWRGFVATPRPDALRK
jgi:uncharacterized membrane protein